MFFLSSAENKNWQALGESVLKNNDAPVDVKDGIRPNLLPAFRFYVGTLLAAAGKGEHAVDWIEAGVLEEAFGLFSNAFLAGFLNRHEGKLTMPVVVFSDPRPFVHFTTIPAISESRRLFIQCCGETLPAFDHPLKIMDIGCGNGALMADLLVHLKTIGKINAIQEVFLIDPSPVMIELAKETVGNVMSPSAIRTSTRRFEEMRFEDICGGTKKTGYDIALSSIAYHHMPLEKKKKHIESLKPWIDHFIIFEIDANHDTPELHSPELALSVYQSYGRLIDRVFAHDAPVDVALACVDQFLMTEAVSILTQPRGVRTEYHMLRSQWRALFENTLAPEFECMCDITCCGDQYMNLFAMHYGKPMKG